MTSISRIEGATWARGAAGAPAWAALRRVAGWPVQLYRARALVHRLAALDAHELRDIGLMPGDLADVAALPLGADPSLMLQRRAEERRQRMSGCR